MIVDPIRVPTVDGYELSVVVTQAEPDDVIIWLHGISVNKDEHLGFFRDGARWLAGKGISSIRFDFRGHGESSGSSLDFSIIGQNLDTRSIFDFAQRTFGSTARVHLVGASFGAPPALFAAARWPVAIRSVTLIAPVLSYVRTFLKPETEWARGLFSKKTLRRLDEVGRLHFDDTFNIGLRLVEEMRVIRPTTTLAELRQPVLILHGDRDSMVPYDASAQACRGLRHVRFVTLEGADHGFMQEGDEEGTSQASRKNKERIYELIEAQVRR
jgi:pimeloyl-ACP methyl ester carboxylesterase